MTKREGVDDKELEFERIALVHLDTIFNAALRLTGHTSDAEDPVQETFLKAYRFFYQFREDSNCLAWLFRIMKNSYFNRPRRKSREAAMVSNDGQNGLDFEPRDTPGEPDKEMLDRLLDDEVEQAVQALPDAFKMVVFLSYIEEGVKIDRTMQITDKQMMHRRSNDNILSVGKRSLTVDQAVFDTVSAGDQITAYSGKHSGIIIEVVAPGR